MGFMPFYNPSWDWDFCDWGWEMRDGEKIWIPKCKPSITYKQSPEELGFRSCPHCGEMISAAKWLKTDAQKAADAEEGARSNLRGIHEGCGGKGKPKRFNLEPTTRCGQPWLEMVEDSMGDWVLYDEYEELEFQNKLLKDDLEST